VISTTAVSLTLAISGSILLAGSWLAENQSSRNRLRRMALQPGALGEETHKLVTEDSKLWNSRELKKGLLVLALTFSLLFTALYSYVTGIKSLALIAFAAIYISLTFYLLQKRYLTEKSDREVLRYTPLIIESLCMLVESGYAILPAIDRIVNDFKPSNKATDAFRQIYSLSSSGHTFEEAIKHVSEDCEHQVLKHALLHILSSQESGGELLPSLKGLADHSQQEWKVRNEIKIKKLENAVVFPVFISVIGLMLMVAAVPLIPLLEMEQSFSPGSIGAANSNTVTNEIH